MVAGLLGLVLVFVIGAFVGHGLGRGSAGQPAGSDRPSPVSVVSPIPTVTPPVSVTAPPTASRPPTAVPSTPEPATAPPTAARTVAPTEVPGSPPPGPEPTVPGTAPDDIGLLWEALQVIQERYVDRGDLDGTALVYGAIRGMVDALGDTGHTVFLTPDEVQAQRESLDGTLTGIGVMIGERAGRPVIVSVLSGAPADAAGLRSGDVVVAVDGVSVERLGPEGIADRVRGEAGAPVTLTIQRRGTTEILDVTIVRARIQVDPVAWTFVPGTRIVDVRLIQFSAGAAEAVGVALQEAVEEGAEAIILDLRSNPGGLVDEAIGVASHFLETGVVYQRRDATGATAPVEVRPDGLALDLPLVLLIDLGTASSAEIVSAAIGDNERGLLIGEQTFGTGTVLNTIDLSDGSAVRVGIERWLTPDGELIFDRGIAPDEVVTLPLDGGALEPGELEGLSPEAFAASSDTQLLRAVERLRELLGD